MRVAVVLDSTAVTRFVQGDDLAVGELLGEVAVERSFAAVPVRALAVAYAERRPDVERELMFTLLVEQNPRVQVVPMLADEGRLVGRYAAVLGQRLGLAHAVREAERHEAQLVTADGEVVRKAFGELYCIVDL